MPFHPVADTVQVRLQGQHGINPVENTLYFSYLAGAVPTATELQALAGSLVSSIAAQITALYTPATVFTQMVLTDLHAAGRAQVVYPITPNIVGSNAVDCLPGNTSLGLRRRTGLQGKTNRGRIELMPFGENHVTGDVVQTSQVTNIAALAARLLVTYPRAGGGIWVPAVASFASATSKIILSWAFDTLMDSMKTRLTGHGA